MLKDKKAVLFDMDGTLIDSVGIWNEVDRSLIREISGQELPLADIQAQRDAALRAFSAAENPYGAYVRLLKERYGSPWDAEKIMRRRYQIAQSCLTNDVDYKPGAEAVLHWLRDHGFTLVIATTTKRSNMDIYRLSNQNLLRKAPIDAFFSRVYTREDVREIKPHPEIHHRVMRDLGLSPEDCLVFEDSLIGIEAANRAGIEAAAIYDRYSDRDWPEIRERAAYWFHSFGGVLEAMETEFA